MSSTFGHLFRVTNFGESHGPAIGCVIDGCPPGLPLSAADLQPDLDRRKPGTSSHVTQRREADEVEILSGVYEGVTTGTPVALLIRNTDNFLAMLASGRDNALLRFSLGNEFLKQGDAAKAAEHLRRAVEHDPKYSAAWKLLGKALTDAENWKEALAAYQQGIGVAEARGD